MDSKDYIESGGYSGRKNHQVYQKLGQSFWYDNITRKQIQNGEFERMIKAGVIRGITSNPTIFHNAIVNTSEYDGQLNLLSWGGLDAESIFWRMAIDDIIKVCDLFLHLYQQTGGEDGYVSIETHPDFAFNAQETQKHVRELWDKVSRPNLMIKIPATVKGLDAIRNAVSHGVNVNATLIFSLERYRDVVESYMKGLEDRLGNGETLDGISSVASFFVSRIDTAVDKMLPAGSSLAGKTAIAVATKTYHEYVQMFKSSRWEHLKQAGAKVQRLLWASTSAKDPSYPGTFYVDNLVDVGTINTIPPKTLLAVLDHGKPMQKLSEKIDFAKHILSEVEKEGVSVSKLGEQLESEGVKTFSNAFHDTVKTIDARRQYAVNSLGLLSAPVKERLAGFEENKTVERLWLLDASLWTPELSAQKEIERRMGWLCLPSQSDNELNKIAAFAKQVHEDGLNKFLLLGMGGSSLAPEVISFVYGALAGQKIADFKILDSTDPDQLSMIARDHQPEDTLYIVASKSGSTIEVTALFNYFWKISKKDGRCFIAITDPGTPLNEMAVRYGFRKIFYGKQSVGGRFSALSVFGLVPSALMGVDIQRMIVEARAMMVACSDKNAARENPGAVLGAVLGEGALSGRDKLCIIADKSLVEIRHWVEQLIMESSGKDGKGIAVLEVSIPLRLETSASDKMYVYLRSTGENEKYIDQIKSAGCPVLEFTINAPEEIGSFFYQWEFGTAIACHVLGINAFDQPDVQRSKQKAAEILNAHSHYINIFKSNNLIYNSNKFEIFGNHEQINNIQEMLHEFLSKIDKRGYLAINAFLPKTEKTIEFLEDFKQRIEHLYNINTIVEFGPRYLHSTGQYQKGGPNNGHFIIITMDHHTSIEINDMNFSFNKLEDAQALGDYVTLHEQGKPAILIHLKSLEAREELLESINST